MIQCPLMEGTLSETGLILEGKSREEVSATSPLSTIINFQTGGKTKTYICQATLKTAPTLPPVVGAELGKRSPSFKAWPTSQVTAMMMIARTWRKSTTFSTRGFPKRAVPTATAKAI